MCSITLLWSQKLPSGPFRKGQSKVKFMSDVPNFGVAMGVVVGVVLTANQTAPVMSEL